MNGLFCKTLKIYPSIVEANLQPGDPTLVLRMPRFLIVRFLLSIVKKRGPLYTKRKSLASFG